MALRELWSPGTMRLQSAKDRSARPSWLCNECGFAAIRALPWVDFIITREPGDDHVKQIIEYEQYPDE